MTLTAPIIPERSMELGAAVVSIASSAPEVSYTLTVVEGDPGRKVITRRVAREARTGRLGYMLSGI